MIYLIDIGNTAATIGNLVQNRIRLDKTVLNNEIPLFIRKNAKSGKKSSNQFIICSVVPKIDKKIKSIRGVKITFLGKDFQAKICHKYSNINKLGLDRLVNLYGAAQKGHFPALVIDFGSAITFDYLDPKGVFQGGLIVPGPELSYRALREKGALLPKKARLPKKMGSFLGRDTLACMNAGILQSYGAMTDELIRRFKKKSGPRRPLKVIITGGFSKNLKPFIHEKAQFNPLHTLESLYKAYSA